MAEAERKSVRQGQFVGVPRGEQTHMTLTQLLKNLLDHIFFVFYINRSISRIYLVLFAKLSFLLTALQRIIAIGLKYRF